MSFSAKVKAELYGVEVTARHCMIAELSAYVNICGELSAQRGQEIVMLHNESDRLLERAGELIEKLFGFKVRINKHILQVEDHSVAANIITTTGVRSRFEISAEPFINPMVVASVCCKRAYIRGAFLCSGSVTDPQKQYHIEFVSGDYDHAIGLRDLFIGFGIEPRVIQRKNHYVLYLKEGEQIVDVLNIMSAHRALLEFENLRIVKEMRNNVNRVVNCETANLNKVVSAAVAQLDAIRLIEARAGLDSLPPALKQMAEVRLEHPDASLKELGDYVTPPIGKSGVNHRLKRICEIASQLKGEKNYG
jgi:DNA-binding protein WhiA